ncbi:MAG: hypothetical protein QXG00_07355 [Candidatus Woesearchaeota archaeon]
MKFRKKPVIIEAVQWSGSNHEEILQFMNVKKEDAGKLRNGPMIIYTLEGTMTASPGDWIIKGVKGEFYPCKPDVFQDNYEKVEE